MAFTDNALTQHAYTESSMLVKKDTGATVADQKKEPAHSLTTLDKVVEFKEQEYKTEKEEAAVIKDDPARTPDEKGAAEIIEKISEDKELERRREEEGFKHYFSNSRDHYVSAFRLKLYKKVKVEDVLVQKELDRRIGRVKATREGILTKYSKVASYADRLLKASEAASKAMAAPVQKTDKKYEDL
jgi:hypothetical protein